MFANFCEKCRNSHFRTYGDVRIDQQSIHGSTAILYTAALQFTTTFGRLVHRCDYDYDCGDSTCCSVHNTCRPLHSARCGFSLRLMTDLPRASISTNPCPTCLTHIFFVREHRL
ncbi:hypothetical protein Mapa_010770 [Marchantia paleacea]|nr:hypothetical protein Mapa_010770 [Marchantia paleacea]